ncbi:MAG: hypothetical protein IJ434_06600 [Alistipes sp.]|nr:hypothetical protein [Alistipes sp.]
MNFIIRLLMLLLPLVVSSCVSDDIYEMEKPSQPSLDVVEAGTTELRLGIPTTRATVDANLDLKWQRGDRITLLAYDGANQIFSKTASFWAALTDKSSVGTQAYFKAKFDSTTEADVLSQLETMADGRCYAISPVKGVTISGTTATITIPTVQTGEYQDAPDFMTARSSSISELKLCAGGTSGAVYDPADGKYINDIDLTFTHHTHAFRVTIPSNNLGREVTKAYVKFPFAVVGDLTVDYTTGAVTAVNNTSDLIVVEFSEPKSAGDEFWVFINGVENKGEVDIRFQTADGTYTERRVATFSQKNWVAGAVSKVRMSIPVATTLTSIQVTVPDYSRLGEKVTNLHFTLSDGYFTDYTTSQNVAADASNNDIIEYTIFSDLIDSSFRAANHSLKFESASAIVPNPDPIVFGDAIAPGTVNSYELSAPYLFEENFSKVTAFEYELSKNTGVVTATSLDRYGLVGWYGARVGANSGAAVIGVRHETVAQYRGRLDTSALGNIKDGKSVNIQVKFHANRSNDYAYLDFGVSLASEGALQGGDDISGASSRIDPATNSSISYTNISATDYTSTFSGITNSNRLSWRLSRDYDFGGNGWVSKTWYVYMDNIRVTIVQ